MTPRSRFLRIVLAAVAFVTLSSAQRNSLPYEGKKTGPSPIERTQRQLLLKAEYEKAVEEAKRLSELADGLKADLEKNNQYVLSISSLKKTEEIEKLAKQIRSRLNRY